MKKRGLRLWTQALLSTALLAGCFAGSALADSACKGLEKRQCEGKGDCTWVDAYTRKDGVKVDGYCRSVGNQSGSSSSSDKKSASKQSASKEKEVTQDKKTEKKSSSKE